MQVVAQNMSLTLRLVQGIEARRVWQVTPMIKDIGMGSIQGRAVVVQLGDLEKTGAAYLIEMMLPPRQPGSYRIAQADVSYNIINQGMQRETSDLLLNYTYDPNLVNQVNGKVMNIVERVTAFKLQTQALNEAELGNVHGATQKLRQAVTILLNQGETDLARQMEREAANLEQDGSISNEGKKTIRLEARKTVRLDNLP
jgi:Ca-activated chloride channel family protein